MRQTDILTKRHDLLAIREEWDDLSTRLSAHCFSSFGCIDAWMQTAGSLEKTDYHIITTRVNGKLTGVLPLCVTHKRFLRLLRWAAHDVFFGPVQIFETEEDREALWRAALASPHYDIAKIKYLFENTFEKRLLTSHPRTVTTDPDMMTLIEFPLNGGENWFNTLSPSTRKDFNRKSKALEKVGPVTFHIWKSGEIPYDRIEMMMGHKKDWAQEQNRQSGIFQAPAFVPTLIKEADRNGSLIIHELRCNEETVALSIDFACGDTLYWYVTTRNPDWARYSPGALSIVWIVKWAADNGFRKVHLFEGSDSYKQRFANICEAFHSCLVPGSWRGRIALALYRLVKKMRGAR